MRKKNNKIESEWENALKAGIEAYKVAYKVSQQAQFTYRPPVF